MAGLALAQRDLGAARQELGRWFADKFGPSVRLTDLTVANKSGGFSSESLLASLADTEGQRDYVVRIPPAGGGLFADYDLQGQARESGIGERHWNGVGRERDAGDGVRRQPCSAIFRQPAHGRHEGKPRGCIARLRRVFHA